MASEDVLTLEVATPTGLVLRTQASSVQAPSVRGEFGVLPGHLPLLAALRCGLLEYVQDGKKHMAVVGSGFVEAEPDKVLILTDQFALPDDVDADAARAELVDAEAALVEFGQLHEGPEYAELQRAIDWCLARMALAEHRDRP